MKKKEITVKPMQVTATIPYDKRSSVFMNAGTNHGCGKPQPIGKK